MARALREIMNKDVQALRRNASLADAAALMKSADIGDVLVLEDDGTLAGIITDRDIVVRAIADGKDPKTTKIGDFCTEEIVCVERDASIPEAVNLMKDHAIRRIPVVENGKPVGIISIGDLAQVQDPDSALGEISSAPPQQ
jgi:CBS domain-containing protein